MIRPATRAEVVEFYGDVGSARMVALEVSGEVLGVGGLVWTGEEVLAVSFLKPEAKAYPKQILRGAHAVQAMAEEMNCDVYATPDPDEPSAAGFLQHIGFEPQEGGFHVYRSEPA